MASAGRWPAACPSRGGDGWQTAAPPFGAPGVAGSAGGLARGLLKFDRYCRVTKPGFSFGATTDRAGKPINSAWKELSSKLLVF